MKQDVSLHLTSVDLFFGSFRLLLVLQPDLIRGVRIPLLAHFQVHIVTLFTGALVIFLGPQVLTSLLAHVLTLSLLLTDGLLCLLDLLPRLVVSSCSHWWLIAVLTTLQKCDLVTELHDLQLVLFVGVLNALLLSLLLLRDRISPVIGSFVIFDHLMKSLGLLVKSRLLLT